MVLVIFYIVFLVFGGAYFTYRLEKNQEALQNWSILVVPLAFISPLLTLLLAKYYGGDQFNITQAGPVGDWLAGSTVPFLTFATFIVAIAAFNSSKSQLDVVREGTKQQNINSELQLKLAQESANQQHINSEIQRFENTFFLLIDELKKINGTAGFTLGVNDAVRNLKKKCRIDESVRKALVNKMSPESREGNAIGEFEVYREMYNRYYNVIGSQSFVISLVTVEKYILKLIKLLKKNERILDDPDFYLDFIGIHVDQAAVLLILYHSLVTIETPNGSFDLLYESGLFQLLKDNQDAINPANDYNLFMYIVKLEDRQIMDLWYDVKKEELESE